MGPVSVDLRVDNSLKPGRFGISSQMRQAEAGKRPGTIVMPSGERIELSDARNVIGRLSDCRIIISRRQHQPPPRRDPPLRQRVRHQRPRLHQRHVRQRRAAHRRPPAHRRRHRHRRHRQPPLRSLLNRTSGPRHRHARLSARHPQARAAGTAVPVLRTRAVGGVERGPSTGRRPVRPRRVSTPAAGGAQRQRPAAASGARSSPPRVAAARRHGSS